MRMRISLLVCLFVCLAPACNRNSPETLQPVSGRVFLDGKPLHKGDVAFVPYAEKGNTALKFGMGKIDAEGNYTAKTFGDEGVKPGWYKVMVLATENEPQESPAWVPIWLVPVKYTKPESTPLAVEVVSEPAAGAYDLKLER